jgi:hypothetical protein
LEILASAHPVSGRATLRPTQPHPFRAPGSSIGGATRGRFSPRPRRVGPGPAPRRRPQGPSPLPGARVSGQRGPRSVARPRAQARRRSAGHRARSAAEPGRPSPKTSTGTIVDPGRCARCPGGAPQSTPSRGQLADAEANGGHARAGKPLKANSAEKAGQTLREAEREEAAYGAAVEQAERDLEDALTTHGAELRKQAERRAEAARKELGGLLDAFAAKHGETASARALVRWLDGVAAGGLDSAQGLRAPTFHAGRVMAGVPGLLKQNGEELHVAEVLAALRALLESPNEQATRPLQRVA